MATPETGAHRADAEQAALHMPDRIVGLHGHPQLAAQGEINDDRNDREGGAIKADLAGRDAGTGKRTLAVRLGPNGAWALYTALTLGAHAWLALSSDELQ